MKQVREEDGGCGSNMGGGRRSWVVGGRGCGGQGKRQGVKRQCGAGSS